MNGGLIDLHHDDIVDECATLCGVALTPMCIAHDPIISSSKKIKAKKTQSKHLNPCMA